MVSMPCDLKLSKMVLFSMHLGAESVMIDIASIMMCQRNFYQPEEKREDIESFMHHLVAYDEGLCNDFYLKQIMFSEWR